MLVAIPFATLNIFSNTAMAQEYDNYGDSYSKYPTDDKKYECQKGPFKGFSVSSPEFCDFKRNLNPDPNPSDVVVGTNFPIPFGQ